MSRKLKALGALNLVGWTVAIPLLMVALVPAIAFHGWPDPSRLPRQRQLPCPTGMPVPR